MATLTGRLEGRLPVGSAGLYEIIDELRRANRTPAAAKTLDMLVEELGETRDNLHQALARLHLKPAPPGAWEILDEVHRLALLAGVDDLRLPPPLGASTGGGTRTGAPMGCGGAGASCPG